MAESPPRFARAASALAKRGLHVFPLAMRSKQPMPGSRGLLDATTDAGRIQAWWTRTPEANIGIACGPSRLIVVDVDPKNGGDESRGVLREQHGSSWDDVVSASTPSGGEHLYYRCPDATIVPSGVHVLGPGIDVRAAGGYVVAPPSATEAGVYRWLASDRELRDPEAWILEAIANGQKRAGLHLDAEPIIAGGRNVALARIAGSLRRPGLSADEIEAALQEINRRRCQPPLPAREVAAIAKSIGLREAAEAFPVSDSGTRSMSFAEMCEMPAEDIEWQIDGMLPRGGLMLLVAPPKAGKSVLARNIALAVATGAPFLGRRTMRGRVLWIALEEHKLQLQTALGAMQFPKDADLRIYAGRAPQDAMTWLARECEAFDVALVVIDTWHKLTLVENVNDYALVNRVNEPLMRLARERGVAQIWLHHSRKVESGTPGGDVLGSQALYAAVDTLLRLRRAQDGMRTITSEQRVGDDLEDTVVAMDDATQRIKDEGSRWLVELARARVEIATALAEAGELSRADLIEAVHRRRQVVLASIGGMLRDGEIAKVSGSGTRQNPERFRNLAPSGNSKPNEGGSTGSQVPMYRKEPRNRNIDRFPDSAEPAGTSELPEPNGTAEPNLLQYARARLSAPSDTEVDAFFGVDS